MQHYRLRAKGIFLDLDGTLVDSTEAYIEAGKIAFRTLMIQPPSNSILLEIPKRMEQNLTLDEITEGHTKKFLPIYVEAFHSISERRTRLLSPTDSTLRVLSKKAKLALITMRYVQNEVIQKELDYFGIRQYFSHIVTGIDSAKPKPSPEGLIKCREALNIEACECLIAGDSIIDIKAGKAAGIKTVALLSGLYKREELEKEEPDLILDDVSLLPLHVE
jgi:phosphoglycolate phosphatase